LESGGHANSLFGDGKLLPRPPTTASYDEYLYDPAHPVPSLGGSCCSEQVAREQSPIESRQDVLVYTSEPFTQPTRIVGDVTATLYFGSSVPDTDLMLKLVDVDSAGRAYNLGDTAMRLRYRNGYSHPQLMHAGQVYSVALSGLVTATDMPPGHRLRIELASSNFPNYERNLNSGGNNFDETTIKTARNRVVHGPHQASFIEFQVLPH
jgi:putative CocE/NonD family hydrolase